MSTVQLMQRTPRLSCNRYAHVYFKDWSLGIFENFGRFRQRMEERLYKKKEGNFGDDMVAVGQNSRFLGGLRGRELFLTKIWQLLVRTTNCKGLTGRIPVEQRKTFYK